MAATKKPRKKYRPKTNLPSKPSYLLKLPISETIAQKIQRDMETRLISMRLTEKTPAQMIAIVTGLGMVWKLADRVEQKDEVRTAIEKAVRAFKDDIGTSRALDAAVYDLLADAVRYVAPVMQCATTEEYVQIGERLKTQDTIDFLEDFITELDRHSVVVQPGSAVPLTEKAAA